MKKRKEKKSGSETHRLGFFCVSEDSLCLKNQCVSEHGHFFWSFQNSGGSRSRTYNVQIMSLMSYQLLYSATIFVSTRNQTLAASETQCVSEEGHKKNQGPKTTLLVVSCPFFYQSIPFFFWNKKKLTTFCLINYQRCWNKYCGIDLVSWNEPFLGFFSSSKKILWLVRNYRDYRAAALCVSETAERQPLNEPFLGFFK